MIFGQVIPRRRKILLIEDNLADAKLALKVLGSSENRHEVVHIADGERVMEYLRASLKDPSDRLPDLIILDLNLPRHSGQSILSEIKSCDELRHLPVIILTSSDSETDIYECYRAQANAYIKKSVDLYEFMESLKSFEKFWLQASQLPRVI